ncbi:hypothetical protein NLM24_43095 [Nocardia zapadnayensis]|nr:hypothetical protein [Nocardia zapadnayensis]MCX0277274.1 hypothetical protein [Nocardia zapadnayensis]
MSQPQASPDVQPTPATETSPMAEPGEVDDPTGEPSSAAPKGLTNNPYELEVVETVERMMGEGSCRYYDPVLLEPGTPIEDWSYEEYLGGAEDEISDLGDLRGAMAYYICEIRVDAERPAAPGAMTLRFFENPDDFMDDFTLFDIFGPSEGTELYTHSEQLWTAPTWQPDPNATREYMSNETGAQIYTWH